MPDISFHDFNDRSFEQFAQALAAEVMGAGMLVFGDGPDGGREAEFTGPIPYPNALAGWKGRTVMQAKFLQRPREGVADAAWLCRQLEAEAEKLAQLNRPVPDNYLLVTNIRLSGVNGRNRKGGQEKVREAFDRHLKPLGVSEFDVWHEEKIAVLLDGHPDLFRSYGAWLGNREVLQAVYRSFEALVPDFGPTMLVYLQRELRSQRATRLQQAGHVGDLPTNLEDLFVDLPFTQPDGTVSSGDETLRLSAGGQAPEAGVLAALLSAVGIKADPATLAKTKTPRGETLPHRFLVLGGPGQGKSTITQFLGQVMRFRLLRGEPSSSLSTDTLATLDAIARRLREIGLREEGVRRYPLRLDLPSFADALAVSAASGGRLSLLEFIATTVAKVAAVPRLDVAIMRTWLGSYPFLVMLDGLDEVPPSGARREVLSAIAEFWDDVGARNADVTMIVTTRLQGYNEELDRRLYRPMEMVRLAPSQALAYAERIALLKLPDPERRSLTLERLSLAARSDATASLMVSPLQVAILFQLVDQRGSAPADRWTLFADYLSIVIKREQEKPGSGGDAIRLHEVLIRRLLQQVGLLLHSEAEISGSAAAYLTEERLEAVASELLSLEGYEGQDLINLVRGILTAATERLVFLEQRTEGRIEFDVRSLQEFMAASELMSGEDENVRSRLRAIAGRSHWQHVYRIAASKAFSVPDAIKFRDAILSINRELDDDGDAERAVRLGATTSLDMCVDGLATGQPGHRRLIVRHALEVLGTGIDPGGRVKALLRTLDEGTRRTIFRPALSSTDPRESRAAWAALLSAVSMRDDELDRLARDCWPERGADQLIVLSGAVMPPQGTLIDDAIADALPSLRPLRIREELARRGLVRGGNFKTLVARFPFLAPLLDGSSLPTIEVEVAPANDSDLSFLLKAFQGEEVAVAYDAPEGRGWDLFNHVAAFVRSPSTRTAVAFLEALRDPESARLAPLMSLPWPLGTMQALLEAGQGLDAVIASVGAGDFGGADDWRAAEARLDEKGMSADDILLWTEGVIINRSISDVGMPYPATMSLSRGRETDPAWLLALRHAASLAPDGVAFDLLRRALAFAMTTYRMSRPIGSSEWLRLFAGRPKGRLLDPRLLSVLPAGTLGDPEVSNALSAMGEAGEVMVSDAFVDMKERLPELLGDHPDEGLMAVALAAVARSRTGVLKLASLVVSKLDLQPKTKSGKDAVAALRVAAGLPADPAALTEEGQLDSVGQYAVLSLLREADEADDEVEHVVSYLATVKSGAELSRIQALEVLKAALDRRRSTLTSVETWRQVGLSPTLRVHLSEMAPQLEPKV